MIFDTHDNLPRYAPLFRGVDPAPLLAWLKTCRDLEPGTKTEFAGDRFFASVLRPETKAPDALKWEAHREYIDLHYILGGGEIIDWAPVAKLAPEGGYDEATDFQLYAPAPADLSLGMQEGSFTFLFPPDGHKPLITDGTNRHVHKVIAKVHRSLMII